MKRLLFPLLWTLLTLNFTATMVSCSSGRIPTPQTVTEQTADRVWAFAQSHPDGFTLDVRTMTVPSEGIAVSYAATQGCYSRSSLNVVVRHALAHDGYVGGWPDKETGRYYFDSTRLFPSDSLSAALLFGVDNGQHSAYILSSDTEIDLHALSEIRRRGRLLVGTTGDYRPLTFLEPDTHEYWGFGIDLAQLIAERLGVEVEFVPTSWPTLTNDVLSETPSFDLAMGGITITDARKQTMLMSEGYLANGKTILCRKEDVGRFRSLTDIDKPEVTVVVNPGGLNEAFAREHLQQATLIIHPRNEEIPNLIAEGSGDVMITEITEAPYYVNTDERLAAPLLSAPFTCGEIGVLMRPGQEGLLAFVNDALRQMKADGTLRRLCEKYGLINPGTKG